MAKGATKGNKGAKKAGAPKATKNVKKVIKKATDATPAPAPVTTTPTAPTTTTPVAATTPKKQGKPAGKPKKAIVDLLQNLNNKNYLQFNQTILKKPQRRLPRRIARNKPRNDQLFKNQSINQISIFFFSHCHIWIKSISLILSISQ